jgi:hypothetical protein
MHGSDGGGFVPGQRHLFPGGAASSMRCLTDGDLANNSQGWQCGWLRHRRGAILPNLQSRYPGPEIRPRRRLCPSVPAGVVADHRIGCA